MGEAAATVRGRVYDCLHLETSAVKIRLFRSYVCTIYHRQCEHLKHEESFRTRHLVCEGTDEGVCADIQTSTSRTCDIHSPQGIQIFTVTTDSAASVLQYAAQCFANCGCRKYQSLTWPRTSDPAPLAPHLWTFLCSVLCHT